MSIRIFLIYFEVRFQSNGFWSIKIKFIYLINNQNIPRGVARRESPDQLQKFFKNIFEFLI